MPIEPFLAPGRSHVSASSTKLNTFETPAPRAMSKNATDLSSALGDGSCLTGSARHTVTDVKSVLVDRLTQYYERRGEGPYIDNGKTLEDVQGVTAKEALATVGKVQQIIGLEEKIVAEGSKQSDIPSIGTRDLAELRVLLSIIFKWGVEPVLARLALSWPSKSVTSGGPRFVDLASGADDYEALSSLVSRLLALLFPSGLHSRLPQTLITTTILNRHLSGLLRPCIALGWLPRSLSTESMRPMDDVRPLIMRLLAMYVLHVMLESQCISFCQVYLLTRPSLLWAGSSRHRHFPYMCTVPASTF